VGRINLCTSPAAFKAAAMIGPGAMRGVAPSGGASREAAMAAFAKSWRRG